jgi:hypothetical protein
MVFKGVPANTTHALDRGQFTKTFLDKGQFESLVRISPFAADTTAIGPNRFTVAMIAPAMGGVAALALT